MPFVTNKLTNMLGSSLLDEGEPGFLSGPMSHHMGPLKWQGKQDAATPSKGSYQRKRGNVG